MRCLKTKTLRQYIDNEFSPRKRGQVGKHLTACAGCRNKMDLIKEKTGFIREKIDTLKPEVIPGLDFVYPKRERKRVSPSFIRLPVPVFSLMVGVILIMAAGLFLQGQKISRLKAPEIKPAPRSSLFATAEKINKSIFIELDLTGYTPIKNPNIIVLKETKNEKKNI